MEQKSHPIDVISVCSADGKIRPLRLRVEDEAHELLRMDIDEVLSVKEISYVGVEGHIFLCRAQAAEREVVLELKYTFRTHTWCLLRRVY